MLSARELFFPSITATRPWDLVRPRAWYPMASFEQAMMEFDDMANRMLSSSLINDRFYDHRATDQEDDDFFKDLPKESKDSKDGEKKDDNSFSSYSYSSSSIVDKNGRRVTSTRRRYEDSSGRLKALHEREVDGKKLRTVWNRKDKSDDGKHDVICSSGTAEEFEKIWETTPFAQAQKKSIEAEQESKKEGEKDQSQEKVKA